MAGTLRGIIHAHTTFSDDGRDDLERLAENLRAHCLSFAALTDHAEGFTAARFAEYAAQCRSYSTADLLLLPGLEYSFGEGANRIEILLIGDRAFVEAASLDAIWAHKQREHLVAILPHPAKFLCSGAAVPAPFDLVEFWNRRYDGGFFPPRRNLAFFYAALRANPRLRAVGGVDYHGPGDPLDLVTVILGCQLRPDAVLDALRRGDFVTEHQGMLLPSDLRLGLRQRVCRQWVRPLRRSVYHVGRWVVRLPLGQRLVAPGLRQGLRNFLR